MKGKVFAAAPDGSRLVDRVGNGLVSSGEAALIVGRKERKLNH